MSRNILNGEFTEAFLTLDPALHGIRGPRQSRPRHDPLANQDVRKHLVEMGAAPREGGIQGMAMNDPNGFIATFKGEHFFLHKRNVYGRTKLERVYRAGDLLSREKISVRTLQYASHMPDRLRSHLNAWHGGEPSPLIALLCTFLEIPDPQLELGRRIVSIDSGGIEFVFIVWFDGKTAVEFADETYRERPTVVNIDLNLKRTANALKGAEWLAKCEYYVLSMLASPVIGSAKAAGKKLARKALLTTYKNISSKACRRIVFRTLRDLGKGVSSAAVQSSLKAGTGFYSNFHKGIEAARIKNAREPSNAEVTVIAQKAAVAAYRDFLMTLIKTTLVKRVLKKNDATFKTPDSSSYGEKFVTLMVRTIYEQFTVELATGSVTLLADPAVAAYQKARTVKGFDLKRFDAAFRVEFDKAIKKFVKARGKAICDAAAKSMSEKAISLL